jgi:hypothetical protein
MLLKEVHVLSNMETRILCNGNKGVVNYIMSSNAFIAMSTTSKVDTHRSMGCVHTHQRMPAIKGWGSPSHIQNVV